MKRGEIVDTVFGLLDPVTSELGLILIDVEFVREGGHDFLRVYIDRDGGVRMEDCEAVSRRLGTILDEIDIIPFQYYLEVSSPGAERTLRKEREFTYFAGKPVEITLFAPMPEGKRFSGTLLGLEDGIVSLSSEGGQILAIPREKIAKARLLAFPKRG